MKRISLLLSFSLVLAACQSAPLNPVGQTQQPLAPQRLQQTFAPTAQTIAPVVIQKSPVLGPVELKPEGQIQVQGSTVKIEIQLPPLNDFSTQALDLTRDNATRIVATVSDSHGKSYTPVGADGNGKVAYPANGVLNLQFTGVVPDQLLVVELQVEDNAAANIPQANLAAVVSHTTTTDMNATINFQTTPTALAMKSLIGSDADRARAINLAALFTKMIEITGITGGANPTYTTHPTLVDTAKLATDLATQQPSTLTTADYRLVGATVGLTVNGLVGTDEVEVDVTDAASTRATDVGATGSITGATPGTGLKVKVGAKTGNSTQYTFAINTPTVTLTNGATTPVTITATPVAVTIDSLTPTFGSIGNTVTIAGTGFSTVAANNTVKFGATTATVSSVNGTGTSMDVVVPAGVSGTQSVTVQVGTQISGGSDYEVVPVINDLNGTTSGTIGTTITINGTGFNPTAANNTIKFGTTTVLAANTTANANGTQLTAVVPAGVSGSQPVMVQVGNRASTGSAFNVTPVLNTLAVSAATPDTVLTLTGSGFSTTLANNEVKFGSTSVNPATVNPTGTSMTVVVPNVFGSMNLSLEVANQSSVNRTFESIPKITSITPAATGSTGTSIVLNGKGFHTTAGSNTVHLGGVNATVTAATATSVTVSVPETPAESADATVKVGNQTSASSGFSILPKLTTLSTAEAVADKAVLIRSQTLTIAGTNFDPTKANNSVTFTMSNGSTATVTGANLISATATQIQVSVPAGVDVAGDVNVTVITNTKTSTALVGTVPTVTLNVNNGGFH